MIFNYPFFGSLRLQWVHGPQTVVMAEIEVIKSRVNQ